MRFRAHGIGRSEILICELGSRGGHAILPRRDVALSNGTAVVYGVELLLQQAAMLLKRPRLGATANVLGSVASATDG